MNNSNSLATNPQISPNGEAPRRWLKSKRISYMALPLIIMATMTEFIILATGWKYQKAVCVPQGMGITFFGIGPIGATILAVELLKLPLAIWTASRRGWQKAFMLVFGLPLICLLTFQLVKDMAVYEMGIALAPASQMLEKATAEDAKIDQLKGELTALDQKKTDRDSKLAALAARKAKSNADLEQSLKRNDESRTDAINLTDYQKKELAAVADRETSLIRQFDADSAQINKTIADLRVRRETEMAQAAKWNAEEARIDNAYKAKLAEYSNQKAAYQKDKAHYDQASFLKRPFMTEPIDPGVPPVRESNTLLKPISIAEIDAQIKTKEAELLTVNTQRRAQVAQVESDARSLREQFDQRSGARRAEADRKRDELLASQAALAPQWTAEEKQINREYEAVAPQADAIRAALVEPSKKAEEFYEARVESIKNTQVHRIATTVEIIRGLLLRQRPVSIKATAKERGDLYTDQISMVRIWVYPVLAFIVAFLPALMVEVGFSTIFEREPSSRSYRMGFLGRQLHGMHVRAGRQKILRAERVAREAAGRLAARDQALAGKTAELKAARAALDSAASAQAEQLKKQEREWRDKLASVTDMLNKTVVEKEALVVLQQAEIERQIQLRPNAWSDRLNRLQQELDSHRATAEAERTALIREQHNKLMEVSEDSKNQLTVARRQMDNTIATNLAQAREDAAREIEKATRREKERLEQQQSEFEKTLQRREEELNIAFDARLAAEKVKFELEARRREAELEREFVSRVREQDSQWNREIYQREEVSIIKLKQREQQLQTEAEVRCSDVQARAEKELLDRELEFERELNATTREADTRLGQALQQEEELLHSVAHQHDAQWQAKLDSVKTELQEKIEKELRRLDGDPNSKARRVLGQLVPGVQW